ncbi:MAG: YqgE/AlgH family protein [Desulfobacterales bacterium]
MEDKENVFLKGQMLLAMPGLVDPNFSKTVTCICEHSKEGALGIIINRIHPFLSAKEIFKELGIEHTRETESIPVHIGGPVHIGEIFILHGPPFDWEGCVKITSTLALSNTKDVLEAIACGKGLKSFMIALGCAGWGEFQLESELQANAWLTSPVSEEIVFEVPVELKWERAMEFIGIDPMQLSGTVGRA